MIRIKDICDAILSYHPSPDISLIRRAYIYASYHHKNQRRISGDPYIVHPLSVAKILTELKADDKTVAAGILHDVVEDTPETIEKISNYFGNEVAFLVDGVTKISNLNVNLNADEKQIENLRKMFVFMAKDVRVIIIKLADRLDNMRTIWFLPEDKRKRIADETLKIFAPIAHRLGLYNMKTELEDRAFEVLYPDASKYVKGKLDEIIPKSQKFIDEVKNTTAKILEKEGLEKFTIESRIKGIYSIWSKMENLGIDIENIYDIIGFRIIVNDVGECYKVLGILHTYFKPVPGRFKDYIAIPKPNGYKSLHTKVIIPGGYKVEFQIRTYDMHREAEEGISAHWIYKENAPISEQGLKIFSWLRGILTLSKESSYYEVKKISEDIYPDEIYVFTPKGDVKVLPRGATVLDFAYAVHTELGEKCVGAKVNGKLQPIDYIVKNGDIVEVITSKSQKPKRAWLNFVATQRAKSRIKQYVVREEREIARETGKETLKREIKKYGIDFNELLRKGLIPKILEKLKVKSLDDLFTYIGFGKIELSAFAKSLKRAITEQVAKEQQEKEQREQRERRDEKKDEREKEEDTTLLVGDLKGVKTRFAMCCSPVYGDKMVGYITKGYGIVIHREDCPQLKFLKKERIMSIPQDSIPEQEYIAKIRFFVDDPEIMSEIIRKMRKLGHKISELISKENNGKFEVELKVKVKTKEDVERATGELSSFEEVSGVQRI